jgi:hypothetical protein
MKPLDPIDRNRALLELYVAFGEEVRQRTFRHIRHHKCVPPEDADALRDARGEEFWNHWRELTKRCQKTKK